jgi:tripartite ATP-independent transporter DctM subunit
MSPEILTIVLFGALIITLLCGMPLAFAMGGIGIISGVWLMGTQGASYLLVATAWSEWTSYVLLAVPLFILMGNFLQQSGIAEEMYQALYEWAGPLRGGLAMGTVVICAIFAAMAGISAVGTITMGLIALPSMLKRGYDAQIAVGCISAGGTLGILIPPSIVMIIYGIIAEVSVGKLFMAGLLPGILMTLLFIAYIGIRAFLNPDLAPAIPSSERLSIKNKIIKLKALALPFSLIILVLGVIYKGICTPTEAAAIGAFGAFLCLVLKRRFSWLVFHESIMKTLTLSCMIMWIIMGAKVFAHVYSISGASDLVKDIFLSIEVSPWLIIIMSQVILFVLGMFMDPVGIMVITCPIFVPIVTELGFDPIWYGILLTINMEMGFISPPFGFNLFYMKAIAEPQGITITDIYRSILPFVLLEAIGLGLVMLFPQLALWLPSMM